MNEYASITKEQARVMKFPHSLLSGRRVRDHHHVGAWSRSL